MFGTAANVFRTEPRKTTGLYVLSAGWEVFLFVFLKKGKIIKCSVKILGVYSEIKAQIMSVDPT